MELTPRKMAVLAAVVRNYIETGEPVGSKVLATLLENAPSSATLRNEMSDLCSLGFLAQPHTSAGRVPTSRGYNLYINSLMEPRDLASNTKDFINLHLGGVGCDPQNIPKYAADALSELTGFPAISSFSVGKNIFLKKVEILPVSRKSGILLIVTSDGRTDSRMVRFSDGIDETFKENFYNVVSGKLKNKPLSEFNKPNLQNLMAALGLDAFSLMPVLTEIYDMAEEMGISQMQISGVSNLYNLFGETDANKLLGLVANSDMLLSVLTEQNGKTQVIFGSDLKIPELDSKVIVLSDYSWSNGFCGRIGVIGNSRMSYEQIIPSIEYVASKLSGLMTEAKLDMED